MPINIVTRPKPKAKFIGVVGLEFDASMSESHTFSSAITDYPVEDGSLISDHITLDPEELSIEVLITDSPIHIFEGVQEAFNVISSQKERSKTMASKLIELWKTKEVFDVITGLRSYGNMAISSIDIPREPTSGKAVRASISLKKIEKVTSKTVALPAEILSEKQNTKDQGSTTQDAGKQPTKPPTEAEESNASLAVNLLKKVGVLG